MALGLTPREIVAKGEYPLLVIASHWVRVPLSDVAVVQNGFAFKSEFFDREKGMPLIRIRDIEQHETEHRFNGSYDDAYVVRKGDILVGMDGDFLAAHWRGPIALLNQRVCRLTPASKHFDDKFFFLCLQPYLNAINAETSSVTVKHLSSRTIEEIPLPLPPLKEQNRIVAKIEELFSELDKGIEALKTAREQLKVYRQAVLKHAFEGKLTAEWREKNKDKLESPEQLLARIQEEREVRYQQQLAEWKAAVKAWESKGKLGSKPSMPKAPAEVSLLSDGGQPALPYGWCWAPISLFLSLDKKPMTTGPFGTMLKKTEHKSSGVPVLGIENIGKGKFVHGNKIFVSEKKAGELASFEVSQGDILISRSGTVGEICEIPTGFDKALISTNLLRVSLNQKVILSQFFVLMFQGGGVKMQVKELCKGSSREFLNQSILKSVSYPLCGVQEQFAVIREVDAKFSRVDNLSEEIDDAVVRLEALRQSILKKAFSGQLVPQDPNDEPASVLLERIRAEKANQAKAGKKTRRKQVA